MSTGHEYNIIVLCIMSQATQSLHTGTQDDQGTRPAVPVLGFTTTHNSVGSGIGYKKHSLAGQSRQPSMPALPEHSAEESVM